MKNFHKVRGKREFLFDDRELFLLGGGALAICVLLFVLGILVGQSLEKQSVASPLVSEEYPAQEQSEMLEQEMDISTPLETDHQQQEIADNAPKDPKKPQRSYFRTLPDTETYVEVEATPVKQADSQPTPTTEAQQVVKEPDVPQQIVKAETPIPPNPTPAVTTVRQAETVVPALPNVPKDPSDEIRLGRQPRGAEVTTPLDGIVYSVQVASSPSRADAERLQQKYGELGYLAYIMTADLGEKGIWYRVRVGNLGDPKEAEDLKKEILTKASHLTKDPFVIKVSE